MTQEDKTLLLVDLCARLPYGVKILHTGWDDDWDDEISTVERVVGIDDEFIYTKVIDMHRGEEYRDDKWPIDTFDDKLFLRPMSSMTKEEKEELAHYDNCVQRTDFFYSHHIDCRFMIEKGLAIEVTEENNPYET